MVMMYQKGSDPIDVHPVKVPEMEMKGWSTDAPSKGKKSTSKSAGDSEKSVAEKE